MLAQPPVWLIVLAFICMIGPLVFIHELGHYVVGRLFGVGAETFSIGFGREVTGWTDRSGTRWKVGWLPLGGYVRFVDDEHHAGASENPGAAKNPRSFAGKPVWQRFLIVLAGPMANFLLAILIFAAFFMAFGAPRTNVVGEVEPDSAAASAGLKPGDTILSIGGRTTDSFMDIRNYVVLRPGHRVVVTFERNGAVREAPVTLQADTVTDEFGQKFERGLLGVYPTEGVLERVSIAGAASLGVENTLELTRLMIDGVGQIVTGERSVKEIGGPLKIAQVAGQRASLGALEFITLAALISINLGFINLLPVPMLDGGHLLFYTIEAIRRRPVSVEAQEWAFRGGLAVLFTLLLFTTVNDLGSFGLWERLGRLIG